MKPKNFMIVFDTITGKGEVFLYEKWINSKTKSLDTFLKEDSIANLEFVLAKENGNPIRVDVTDVHVDETYRRHGMGRVIMRTIQAIAEYYNLPIELESTTPAIKFYQKLGFKLINRQRGQMVWRKKEHAKRIHKAH